MVSKKTGIAPRHRDPEVVQKAEEIFAGVKMTPDAAVAMFYKLTALRGDSLRAGKPLNAESLPAFNEPRESIAIYIIVDEMMADLWEVSQTAGQSFTAGGMEAKAATPTGLDPKNPESAIAQKAETVFAQMGMTPEEAIATFYERTALHDDCLLCLAYGKIPNEETQAAIREARAGIGIKKYASVAEMRADLNKDA